jgi:N-acetylglucosaminyldiphosphoundecaprenol N-acetyl-beta-D-mannosaminyltransferase
MRNEVTILGVRVDNRTSEEIAKEMQRWITEPPDRIAHVATVNPEFIMFARKNHLFLDVLRSTRLATADGIGVVLAARLQGIRQMNRLTGVDLVELLAGLRNPTPRLFLLGAAEGVAHEAGQRLKDRFPGACIEGAWSGSPRDEALDEILHRIAESGANTLLVAFGAPEQDLWIARHHQRLARCGIVIAIGVGGTFDYLSGRVQRAPRLVRRIGLEWLYRLIRQPWRWRRQLALPKFAGLVIWERITGKGKAPTGNHGSSER